MLGECNVRENPVEGRNVVASKLEAVLVKLSFCFFDSAWYGSYMDTWSINKALLKTSLCRLLCLFSSLSLLCLCPMPSVTWTSFFSHLISLVRVELTSVMKSQCLDTCTYKLGSSRSDVKHKENFASHSFGMRSQSRVGRRCACVRGAGEGRIGRVVEGW